MEHFSLVLLLLPAILQDDFLVNLRPCLLHVCLIDVEDIVNHRARIDIVMFPLAFRHLFVLLVLNLLIRVLINDRKAGKEDRETLLALVNRHHRALIPLGIHCRHIANRCLVVIETHHSVECTEHRVLVPLLLTVHQEHEAVHTIVASAR